MNFTRNSSNNECTINLMVIRTYISYCILCLLVVGQFPITGFVLFASTGSSNSSKNASLESSYNVQIDLSAIAQIESSGRASAVGDGGKALGLYQLHQAVITDYNRAHKTRFKHSHALDPKISHKIASWYLNTEIPRLIRHFRLPDTPEMRLRAYNEGLKRSIKGRQPSTITRAYIAKYKAILKQRRVL